MKHAPTLPPASSRQATPRKPRQRRLVYFYPDKPEDWRVSFRCFAPEGRTFRQARRDADVGATPEGVTLSLSKGDARTRRKPKRFFDAWPVALRYEALVRVFNNPVPFAKRLARTLRAKPERVKDILRAPPQAEHRIDDFIEMGERAEKGAAIAFPNTS